VRILPLPGKTQIIYCTPPPDVFIVSDVAQEIRRMPDFVVQDPRNKAVFFIEYKFRASGEFNSKNLPKDYPYGNAYIVLVSRKHIKCLTVEEMRNGAEITPKCGNYLGNRREFNLDKQIIIDFCDFAVQFLNQLKLIRNQNEYLE
jgi:hypothetical protein